jgi:hypothetical protein
VSDLFTGFYIENSPDMKLFKFLKKGEKNNPADPDMLYILDRLHIALGEEFREGLIGKKQQGYLSRTKRVGVLPANVYPPYKSKLKKIKKEELIKAEKYIGVLGGTLVEYELFHKVLKALEKDKSEYTLLINKNMEMPLIICTKYANIIISPVMRSYD